MVTQLTYHSMTANSDHIETLRQQLSHADPRMRQDAAEALGKANDVFAIPLLQLALDDDDTDVRLAAIAALVALDQVAFHALQDALLHADEKIRQQAVLGLGKLGNQSAVPDLIKCLDDPEILTRGFAAFVLAELGDSSAIEPLIDALGDTDPIVRRYVVEALGQFRATEALPALGKMIYDENTEVAMHTVDALGRFGDDTQPYLIAALQHPDPIVRQHAVLALDAVASKAAIAPLIDALKDSDEQTRGFAAVALGNLGQKQAIKPLLALLRDQSDLVRRYTVEALGHIGSNKATKSLRKIVKKDPSEAVVRKALAALKRIDSDDARQVLHKWDKKWAKKREKQFSKRQSS